MSCHPTISRSERVEDRLPMPIGRAAGVGNVQIRVLRDACCSQDDQLGPLETTYSFGMDATLSDLVRAVISSKFLQYSSTHTTLTGFIEGVPFVKVPSEYYLPGSAPEYSLPGDAPLATVVRGRAVEFRF